MAAAVIACLLALAAIAVLGAVYTTIWVSFAVAAFALLGWVLADCLWQGKVPPGFVLLWPAAGFAVLVLWQGFGGHSIYPYATRTACVQLLGLGALFYAAFYGFRRGASIRWAGSAIWLFAGGLAAEAIVQYYTSGGKIYWLRNASYGTPVGPFVYHNFFAGCMDMLLPVCVGGAFVHRSHDWSERLRRGLPVALALIAVVMSESRGGLFTILFEIALAVLYWLPQVRTHRHFRRSAVIGFIALLAVASLASWGPVAHRLSLLAKGDVSARDRATVAATSWRIWQDYRWTGTGMGTFAAIYPKYETFDDGLTWVHAHDEYAQALVETGAVGVGLALVFAALLIGLGWRMRAAAPEPATVLAQCAWIGLIGFLFHSAGDFLFHAPGLAMLFFVLAGLVAARARHLRRIQQTRRATSVRSGPVLAALPTHGE